MAKKRYIFSLKMDEADSMLLSMLANIAGVTRGRWIRDQIRQEFAVLEAAEKVTAELQAESELDSQPGGVE